MPYRLQRGIEHPAEDNEPKSVSADDIAAAIDYGPRYEDAVEALWRFALAAGHTVKKIDGGLFKHLPGTQGIFLEEWVDNSQPQSRIWLVRLLT